MKKHFHLVSFFIFLYVLFLSSCGGNSTHTTSNSENICTMSSISCQHSFEEWVNVKEASCIEDGIMVRSCSICFFEEKLIIPKNNKHIEIVVSATEPTCDKSGVTEGKICSLCGFVILEQAEVDPLGHIFNQGVCRACKSIDPIAKQTDITKEYKRHVKSSIKIKKDYLFNSSISNAKIESLKLAYNIDCVYSDYYCRAMLLKLDLEISVLEKKTEYLLNSSSDADLQKIKEYQSKMITKNKEMLMYNGCISINKINRDLSIAYDECIDKLSLENSIHEVNKKDIEIKYTLMPLEYIAFGDSITHGYDCVNDKDSVEKPYPQLIKDTLLLYSVNNYGVSGATLTHGNIGKANITSQIKNADGYADIVSVLAGINDYYSNVPLGAIDDEGYSTVYGSLNCIIYDIKEKYPNAFIFFMTPYDCWDKTGKNSAGVELSDIAQAVRDVCAKHNIPVLDLYENGCFSEKNDPLSDGIHPTQDFFVNYSAPMISNFIKENYKK